MLNRTNPQCNMIIMIMVTAILKSINCDVMKKTLGSCPSINLSCTFLWASLFQPQYLYINFQFYIKMINSLQHYLVKYFSFH